MQALSDNTAVVTGGSKGIGLETCRRLVETGYRVVSLGRTPPEWSDSRFHFMEVDLLDSAATSRTASEIAERFDVSHFIHNAGTVLPASLGSMKGEDFHNLSQLHLGAAVALAQAFVPAMTKRRFGRIILISSRGALSAPGRSAYSATKSGMIGLARSWALELAAAGITVNVVAPGPIGGTEMFRSMVPEGSEREAALLKSIPVQRLGRVEDVVKSIMFFADQDSDFITGQTLYVCGGTSVGVTLI